MPVVYPTGWPSSKLRFRDNACVGVCGTGGELVGVITDGDLRRHMDDGLLSRTVTEIMHPNPKTIASGNLAVEALGLMNRFAITALFVVDDEMRPIGFL